MVKEAQAGEVPGPILTLPDPVAASTGARLGEIPAAALPRLARAASSVLDMVGCNLEVRSLEDGRAAIVLPMAWAELLCERLRTEAATLSEELRRARYRAMQKEAETRAALRESRREWEAEAEAIYGAYKRLVAEGLPHAEALRELRGRDGGGFRQWNITSLTAIIQEQAARQRRRQREAQRERILELHRQGMMPKAIARELNVTKGQVHYAISFLPRRERLADSRISR